MVEDFVLWQCSDCSCGLPRMCRMNTIGAYYQSPEYISHTNTSKGLVNRLYQRVRNYTLDQKASLVMAVQKKQAGSWISVPVSALFCIHIQKKGWEAEGIEPDQAPAHRQKNCISCSCAIPQLSVIFLRQPSMPLRSGMCWNTCTSYIPTWIAFMHCYNPVAGYLLPFPITNQWMRQLINYSGQLTMCPGTCIIFHQSRWKPWLEWHGFTLDRKKAHVV